MRNKDRESEHESITDEERKASSQISDDSQSSSGSEVEEDDSESEQSEGPSESQDQSKDSSTQKEQTNNKSQSQNDESHQSHPLEEVKSQRKSLSIQPGENHKEKDTSLLGSASQPTHKSPVPSKDSVMAKQMANFRDKKYQSFVKLRSDMFKVTSQASLKSDRKLSPDISVEKQGKTRVDVYRVQNYQVYFGDPGQMAMNQQKAFQNKVRTQRYTALTWAPLSLIFQFKRIANIYFLIISVLTFLSFSPKEPASMIGTFALVLFFTMLKEAYEDYQRYRQDKEVNNKLALVLNPLTIQFENKKWQDVVCGNIVKFLKDQEAPADLMIIHSSNDSGVVYVDTMNLDGETNLKEKNALLEHVDERMLTKITGEVKCDEPNENLDKWDARVIFKDKSFKQQIGSIKNLLLRGCFVRNTEYGIGIVVYTGMTTKIMKNLKKPAHKVSNIMRLMNKMLYSVFAFQIILITLFAALNVDWVSSEGENHYYLNLELSWNAGTRFILQLLTYWVAYSHLIPISLYVIIEILKLGTASFVNKDVLMYDKETESFARCRNSDLIEELGQVEMVFSDKTGTLTQNKMIFKKCQINGIKYGEPLPHEKDNPDGMMISGIKDLRKVMRQESDKQSDSVKAFFPYITEFFLNLALCNTVVCEKDKKTNDIIYKASSPDELALANGAKISGIKLHRREHDRVFVHNLLTKQELSYRVIAEFPFDSVRKRMSVILKGSNGEYQILCKGADSVMLDRIMYEKNGIDGLRDIIEHDLYTYSCEGLRTLMMGKRTICKEEYDSFRKIYDHLQQSGSPNKDEKLNMLYDAMEQKLRYLGCTAIEDKLQDGVPITISKLLEADIRFFMLTGDKLETAIEIAKSCQIIQDDMNVVILAKPDREKIHKKLQRLISIMNIDTFDKVKTLKDVKLEKQVITIEGSTLTIVLGDDELQTLFFHIAIRSKSVVCCRMSPKQKADVVQMFKCRGPWITLAIGDGANDVSMIMEAHIGVGIKGKEGTQAVRSADFAISQFQYLLRLVLLHGRYGYLRVSQMICYYFYKNIILVFTEIYFASYGGYSGQIFFLDWLSVLYNAFFTSWHCLFAYLLEMDVNDHYTYKYPKIYKAGQLGKYFSFKIFWKWIILAVWHGVVCFFAPIMAGVASSVTQEEGKTGDHWLHSTISFTVIIHLVFYKLLLEITNFNKVTLGFGILSILIYYIALLLAQIPAIAQTFQPQFQGLVELMVSYPQFWILLFGAPIAALVPDFLLKFAGKVFFPNPVEKVILAQKENPLFDFNNYLNHQDKEDFKRRQSIKEVKMRKEQINELQMSFNENALESQINLQHIADQLPRSFQEKGKNKRRPASSSSDSQVSLSHDQEDSQNISGMIKKAEHDNNRIDEVDEDDVTDSDDGSRSSGSDEEESGSSQNEEDQDEESGKSHSKDQSQSNSKSRSQDKSMSMADQSFRSNRGLLAKERIIKEVRDQRKRKDDESNESMGKKLKSKASLKGSNTLKSKKSMRKKESIKVQNNSMFSVSDASKSEFHDDKIQGKSEYLEYFEDLNKEIVERQNTAKLMKNKQDLKSSKTKQGEGVLTDEQLQQIKSQQKIQKKVTIEEVKKSHDRKSLRGSHQSLSNVKEESLSKQLKSISDAESQKKLEVNDNTTGQLEIMQEVKRPQTTNRVDKNFFMKILGNRTQNVFIISTAQEIPKSKVTKPHQIVDQIHLGVQDRPMTTGGKGALNYMFGHPLESNRIIGKSPRASDEMKSTQKKKKKYVEKYNANGVQINYED